MNIAANEMRREGALRMPESVKDILREFTVGYLLEPANNYPQDVIDFGVKYFTQLKNKRAAAREAQERSMPSITTISMASSTHTYGDIETMVQRTIPKKTILDNTRTSTITRRPSWLYSPEPTDRRDNLLVARLSTSLLFRNMDIDERKSAVQLMSCVVLCAGEFVYRAGDVDDHFYIVERGDLLVTTNDGVVNRMLEPYEAIGELALLYNYPRHTNVQVQSFEAVLWTLSRKNFRRFMIDTARANLRTFEKHLKMVPIFRHLSQHECRTVLRAMSVVRFHAGERIFAEGEIRKGIYFIVSGTVSLCSRDTYSGGYTTLATLEEGDYIGELSLITKLHNFVSAFAETDVKTVFLCLAAFNRLVGSPIGLIKRMSVCNRE